MWQWYVATSIPVTSCLSLLTDDNHAGSVSEAVASTVSTNTDVSQEEVSTEQSTKLQEQWRILKQFRALLEQLRTFLAQLRREYGKPGMPEQPGSAGTDKFLRLGSRASSNNTNYQIR